MRSATRYRPPEVSTGHGLTDAVLRAITNRAAAAHQSGGSLEHDVADLVAAGATVAPVPYEHGGLGLGVTAAGTDGCLTVLRALGGANLSLARLYEGHVNAIKLVHLCGTLHQQRRVFGAVKEGLLLGVWGADGEVPVTFASDGAVTVRLSGTKRFASGLHLVGEAVVSARTPDGPQLLLVPVTDPQRADASAWQTSGMRATHSGTYRFDGVTLESSALLGSPGDLLREPYFEGGVWRYCAAHLGSAEALYGHMLEQLTRSGRAGDAHQERRLAEAAIACETARLWLEGAAARVECGTGDPEGAAAYALLAREVTVKASTTVMALAEEALGMAAYDERLPVDRIRRDLGLFLRQAAPDAKRARAAQALIANATTAEGL